MSDLAQALEEKIRTGEARLGTLGLGYVGPARSPSSSRPPGCASPASTSRRRRWPRSTAASPTSRTCPPRASARWSARAGCAPARDFDAPGRVRRRDHLRAHAAQQDQGPRPHDGRGRGARPSATRLRPGQLVVLESTTYPGTTEELILPLLSERGLTVGESFFLAFSPERVDPGNARYNTRNTPKIIGGMTPDLHRAWPGPSTPRPSTP